MFGSLLNEIAIIHCSIIVLEVTLGQPKLIDLHVFPENKGFSFLC